MFGGCQHAGDEKGYKGEPKDLIGIDEASRVPREPGRFRSGWLRSKDPKQRVRTRAGDESADDGVEESGFSDGSRRGPTRMIRCFRIRSASCSTSSACPMGSSAGREEPFDVTLPNGKTARALSRTFIPAELCRTIRTTQDGLRSAARGAARGNAATLRARRLHGLGLGDADNQVISNAVDRRRTGPLEARWLRRVRDDRHGASTRPAVGATLPCSHGAMARWYAPIVSAQGPETADGSAAAATIIAAPTRQRAGGGRCRRRRRPRLRRHHHHAAEGQRHRRATIQWREHLASPHERSAAALRQQAGGSVVEVPRGARPRSGGRLGDRSATG